jgi:hypothetical protein
LNIAAPMMLEGQKMTPQQLIEGFHEAIIDILYPQLASKNKRLHSLSR